MKENRLETARKLGVWKTVNLTGVEDAVAALCAETENERGADVVIEATGLIGVWETSVQMARKGGFILLFGGYKGGSVLSCRCYTFTLFTGNDKGCVPYHSASCNESTGAVEDGCDLK